MIFFSYFFSQSCYKNNSKEKKYIHLLLKKIVLCTKNYGTIA